MTEFDFGTHLQEAVLMPALPEGLRHKCKRILLEKGSRILTQQEQARFVYLVVQGRVVVYSLSRGGQENKIALVTDGGVIGEMEALVSCLGVVYHAKAMTNCELIRMPKEDFLRWIQSDASTAWQMVRVLAAKLFHAALQASQYIGYDAKTRLASFLSQLGPGRAPHTRQEIAEACSMSLRTVNRCVDQLKKEGLLGTDRGKIAITPQQHASINQFLLNE